MSSIKIVEVYNSPSYAHIDFHITDFDTLGKRTDIKFKSFAHKGFFGLEFRNGPGWPELFENWPGNEEDSYGSKFVVRSDAQVPRDFHHLSEADLNRLILIVKALPDILRSAFAMPTVDNKLQERLRGADDALLKTFAPLLAQNSSNFGQFLPISNSYENQNLIDAQISVLTGLAASRHRLKVSTEASRGADQVAPDIWWNRLLTSELIQLGANALPKNIDFVAPGVFLMSKHREDRASAKVSMDDGSIYLQMSQITNWARLASPIALCEELFANDRSYSISIKAVEGPCVIAGIGLAHVMENKSFRILHKFRQNLSIDVVGSTLEFSIRRSIWNRVAYGVEGNTPIFFFFEFSQPANIWLGPLTAHDFEEAQQAPYRESESPTCQRLAKINAELSVTGKLDRYSWLISEAEVAFRAECLDTTIRLVDQILPNLDALNKNEKKRLLTLYAEVAFIEDRRSSLYEVLLAHLDIVKADDNLFTAFSLCFPHAQETDFALSSLNSLGRLPSGKINRAFLGRYKAELLAPHILFTHMDANQSDAQSLLLAANHMQAQGPVPYKVLLNAYLKNFGLAALKEVDFEVDNVLTTFKFPEIPKLPFGPKVSIIMSAYNAGRTVGYAIRSLLEQSYGNFELLICDDSSTDDTHLELLRHQTDSRVHIYQASFNQGPYNTRNALLEHASGDFITFHDADDYAHPQRLERQLAQLEADGSLGCFGRWLRIRPDGTFVFFRDHQCQRMCVVSLMMSQDAIRGLGGYMSALCGADSDFLERARMKFGPRSIVEIDQPLIFGLWSNQSLTRQVGLEATEEGARSPARRAFAEIAARQRFLGNEIVCESDVEDTLKRHGIFRERSPVQY